MGVGSSSQLPGGRLAAAVRRASAWRSSNTPACRHSAVSAGGGEEAAEDATSADAVAVPGVEGEGGGEDEEEEEEEVLLGFTRRICSGSACSSGAKHQSLSSPCDHAY